MFLNIICLVIWIIQLILGFYNWAMGEPVSTGTYICACIICIMFFIEQLVM